VLIMERYEFRPDPWLTKEGNEVFYDAFSCSPRYLYRDYLAVEDCDEDEVWRMARWSLYWSVVWMAEDYPNEHVNFLMGSVVTLMGMDAILIGREWWDGGRLVCVKCEEEGQRWVEWQMPEDWIDQVVWKPQEVWVDVVMAAVEARSWVLREDLSTGRMVWEFVSTMKDLDFNWKPVWWLEDVYQEAEKTRIWKPGKGRRAFW